MRLTFGGHSFGSPFRGATDASTKRTGIRKHE
jgi:hypothetical protein